MDSYTVTLVTLIAALVILTLLLSLALFAFQKILRDKKEVELAQMDLLSKAVMLLSAKDPLAYQAIAVMDSVNSSETSLSTPERTIEELLVLAENDDPSLTEADYERIDVALYGSNS
jgi:hypothetical protein